MMVEQLSSVDGVGIKNLSPLPGAQSLVGTLVICCFFGGGDEQLHRSESVDG